jgi:electron transfer flavoprotein beta subunit
MKIIVSFKVVHDDRDIQITGDGGLDYTKASQVVSAYDLNAIEAAATLAASQEAALVGISAGPTAIDDSKLKKNVLARGVDEVFMIADDSCANMDAHASAQVLKGLIEKVGSYDLVVCGDGSADNYAQQVDVQLAAALGVPVITSASRLSMNAGMLEVERTLEDVVEVVRTSLPAVVSVLPDAALPRLPGMKDIVAAGKKPAHIEQTAAPATSTLKVLDCKAPKQADRKLEILDASADGAIKSFAEALKAAQL